jgi:gamma-glutamyltranspeptidase/glutathione hydrolase
MLVKPGGRPIALNASGLAPAAATAEWYADKGIATIEVQSPHAVTVPGAVDGWARLLADHGTMTLRQVLAPAIGYAERGFPLAPRVAHDWGRAEAKIRAHAGASAHLLKDGRAPRVGEIMRLPALGRTLRIIAEQGRDGFYLGEVAEDIVAELQALGGLHTMSDFVAQRCSYVEPISVSYRGVDIHELPPNNQGIVALIMLNMLSRMGPLSDDPTAAARYHVMIEAARLAYAMRDAFVADPDMAKVPVAHMLSAAVADDLVARIDRQRRTPDLGPVPSSGGSDTVYLAVVDESGMAVSFINSLFSSFGSGIATRKTGVVLHNRATGFVLDPRHPNCIAPRKRPLHTLVPALAMREGKPLMAFGVMGAAFQPIGHAYVVSNLLDYGLDPQSALDVPRAFFEGNDVLIEQGIGSSEADRLRAMGHSVKVRDEPWGGGQIVYLDRTEKVLVGASDHRKDGCALGY